MGLVFAFIYIYGDCLYSRDIAISAVFFLFDKKFCTRILYKNLDKKGVGTPRLFVLLLLEQ